MTMRGPREFSRGSSRNISASPSRLSDFPVGFDNCYHQVFDSDDDNNNEEKVSQL